MWQRCRFRRRVSQNEDLLANTRLPQLQRLGQAGHADPVIGEGLLQDPGGGDGTMAVGIGFQNIHKAAAGGEQLMQYAAVADQSIQADLHPAAAGGQIHVKLLSAVYANCRPTTFVAAGSCVEG